MPQFEVGSLVTCRERDWVVLPSEHTDLLPLRPLGGSEIESCSVFLPIEGHRITPATFPYPQPSLSSDFEAGRLLRDAARLSLRTGAGPFRSLGRLGVRPRPYQLVPLIMALRLDPVRLLIADDVGIGKTIEAGLIVRELLDRGELRGLAVLCPPHLCEQWQQELHKKFMIEAVVVRSSTIAALEKGLPRGTVGIYDHYPFTVSSIDYVKGERHRDSFLRACPACVIVDEAHTATRPRGRRGGAAQQQRYELVRDVASRPARHLLLLTATPHSGIEDSFQSLLGLLEPAFADLDLGNLSEQERTTLARHFVQRRRADVLRWLGEETPFPRRQSAEVRYALPRSSAYRALFDDVYKFARELIRQGRDAETPAYRQRVRYWAALALLRCVMSSPAAAEKALRARAATATGSPVDEAVWGDDDDAVDALLRSYVYDTDDQEGSQDTEPAHVVEQGSPASERNRLRRFAARAAELRGANDPKLQAALTLTRTLLRDGFHPIIYCRYIATANYLAQELRDAITSYGSDLRVLSITGERSEQERDALVAELSESPRRVLVATDCLSEGINLQASFDAVVHYDLPWNPNRLEQREGRVDRYGQRRAEVRTALIMSEDNPMDEAVMTVLLRKAVEIHRTLGISVPVPMGSQMVISTLIDTLFQPQPEQLSFMESVRQLTLNDANEQIRELERQWEAAVEREEESRTRFAQRRIKPEDVARELEESDAVLGDAATVARFVRGACERLGAPLTPHQGGYLLSLPMLPPLVRERVSGVFAPRPGASAPDEVTLAFATPAPDGVVHIGRNHALTAALADYLLETALTTTEGEPPPAARCGLLRSGAVAKRTTLLLLRVRMLLQPAQQKVPMLAEELVVVGYQGRPGAVTWLDEADALALLEQAQPSANITEAERTMGLQRALEHVPALADDINRVAQERAERLRESHLRVRRATGGGAVQVRPHLPPDVLGLYVLLPVVSR